MRFSHALAFAFLLILILFGTQIHFRRLNAPFEKESVPDTYHPTWLIATMCPAKSQTRRSIIRSTWQALYQSPHYDTRFVLSNYDDVWDPLIQKENATYGDIIKLKDLDPSPEVANTIKSVELFKYVVAEAQNGSGKKYDWVSKIDDDAFLEAHAFYDTYLNNAIQASNYTLIGHMTSTEPPHIFQWPWGAFYTMTWELVEQVVQQAIKKPITTMPEDVLLGVHIYSKQLDVDFVHLGTDTMFDVSLQGARHPARITKDAILAHMLKDDKVYLEVATLFDENGYNGKHFEGLTAIDDEEESDDRDIKTRFETQGRRKKEWQIVAS